MDVTFNNTQKTNAKLGDTEKLVVIGFFTVFYVLFLIYANDIVNYGFSSRNLNKKYAKTYSILISILITIMYIVFTFAIIADIKI
jgi:hypothetical protein